MRVAAVHIIRSPANVIRAIAVSTEVGQEVGGQPRRALVSLSVPTSLL